MIIPGENFCRKEAPSVKPLEGISGTPFELELTARLRSTEDVTGAVLELPS
jgi:hypothetical protein